MRPLRILVTGASGFVGRWLVPELQAAGHLTMGLPDPPVLDVADRAAVREAVRAARPDAVAHLAAMAFGPDAAADPAEAIRVNLGGTLAVVEACRSEAPDAGLLVIGSSEVYDPPADGTPITETSPLGPRGTYGLTKLAAESLALAAARSDGPGIVVARSFNHTGPGQRDVFAVPAFARRIVEARRRGVHEIAAGNVDVARDISDVRDVVRAYRLILESLAAGRVGRGGLVFNVASGRAVTMRTIIDRLAALADWPVTIVRDEALVRADDPPVILGDATALRQLTGWTPSVELDRTLADLLESLA